MQDIKDQKLENETLQHRLQAEEQLRKEAEQKSYLIQIELERLQRKLRKTQYKMSKFTTNVN